MLTEPEATQVHSSILEQSSIYTKSNLWLLQAGDTMFGLFGRRFDPFDVMGFDSGYDDFYSGGHWANCREKSAAATQREEDAKQAFSKLRNEVQSAPPLEVTKYPRLDPSQHLTQPCLRDFKKVVKQYPGWTVKRTAATAEDRRKYKVCTIGLQASGTAELLSAPCS